MIDMASLRLDYWLVAGVLLMVIGWVTTSVYVMRALRISRRELNSAKATIAELEKRAREVTDAAAQIEQKYERIKGEIETQLRWVQSSADTMARVTTMSGMANTSETYTTALDDLAEAYYWIDLNLQVMSASGTIQMSDWRLLARRARDAGRKLEETLDTAKTALERDDRQRIALEQSVANSRQALSSMATTVANLDRILVDWRLFTSTVEIAND